MTFHPHNPDGYPNAGTQIGPAWRALLEKTSSGDWITQDFAMDVMQDAGRIQQKTAYGLIYQGLRAGFLEQRQIPCATKPRKYELRRHPDYVEPGTPRRSA